MPRLLGLTAALVISLLWGTPARSDAQWFPPAQLPQDVEQALGELAGDPLFRQPGWRYITPLQQPEPLPLYVEARADPAYTPAFLLRWGQSLPDAQVSPLGLSYWASHTLGVAVTRLPEPILDAPEADPLILAMAQLVALRSAEQERFWPVPDAVLLPQPLRGEVAHLLQHIARSERFRQRAFAALPPELTVDALIQQATEDGVALFTEPDFREWLPHIDYAALAAGYQELVRGVTSLQSFLRSERECLPALAVRFATPLGEVVIATGGEDSHHHVRSDTLLLIDTQGDDQYLFTRVSDAGREARIRVLIDVAGEDRYVSTAAAAGPDSAVLGYGVVWDADGQNRFLGERLSQSAALLGASLLVNEAGGGQFIAQDFSQAFALAGIAILSSGAGADSYRAVSYSQGSAGPWGVALLQDAAGDDHYQLDATPLVHASAQLPDRNVSLGQGAGWGWRADRSDGRSLPGGVGVLLDQRGNDQYHASVFAQGAAYWAGLGVLVDREGADRYASAWYGLGAAAHEGLAALLDLGNAADEYRLSHHAGAGLANDGGAALFFDQGGDDRYQLPMMSQGAVADRGLAVFVDAGKDQDTLAITRSHLGSHDGGQALLPLARSRLFASVGEVLPCRMSAVGLAYSAGQLYLARAAECVTPERD